LAAPTRKRSFAAGPAGPGGFRDLWAHGPGTPKNHAIRTSFKTEAICLKAPGAGLAEFGGWGAGTWEGIDRAGGHGTGQGLRTFYTHGGARCVDCRYEALQLSLMGGGTNFPEAFAKRPQKGARGKKKPATNGVEKIWLNGGKLGGRPGAKGAPSRHKMTDMGEAFPDPREKHCRHQPREVIYQGTEPAATLISVQIRRTEGKTLKTERGRC